MTKSELLEELKSLINLEPEGAHQMADRALIEYIGDEEIEEAYEAVEKWYS